MTAHATRSINLDALPPGWEVLRLDECCSFVSGGTPSKANAGYWDGPIPWASPKDLKRPRLQDTQDHISADGLRVGSSLAPVGAVFVVVRGMILARDVPIARVEVPMAFNQDLKAVVPGPRVDSEFLLYAMRANRQQLVQRIGLSAHGTRTLMSEDIGATRIGLPPRSEQQAIARALWAAERAITTERRSEATARGLKQAAMRQLFTRDWAQDQLGDLGKIGNGSTPKRTQPEYWTGGTLPWLTSGKIHERVITAADEHVTPSAASECHLPRVPAGSLLIAITGQGKTLGNVALTMIDTFVSQHLAYLTIERDDVDPNFIRHYLSSRYDDLRAIGQSGGSTKGAITCAALKTVPVPVPPIGEQHEIARALDVIDHKIALHERKRATLQELFDTLLHDLMTGRLRVRDFAPA